jgi:hypothetical protein
VYGSSPPAALSGSTGTGSSTGMQLSYSQTKNWKNGTVVGGTGVPAYGGSNDTAAGDYTSKNYVTFNEDYGWRQASQDFVNQYGTGYSQYAYTYDGALYNVNRGLSGGGYHPDANFKADANGFIVDRFESHDPGYSGGSLPITHTYRFGGKEMGLVTNNNTTNIDYATLIDRRDDVPGAGYFLGGASSGTAHAGFDANHITLAGGAQEGTPGSWTVRAGDTLQSIALAVWGDAGLWYKIALANGISDGGAAAEGQVLPENARQYQDGD